MIKIDIRPCIEGGRRVKCTEILILSRLLHNSTFVAKIRPILKVEYFTEISDFLIADVILKYLDKYNAVPEAVNILLEERLADGHQYEEAKKIMEEIKEPSNAPHDLDWLLEMTVTWCRNAAAALKCV